MDYRTVCRRLACGVSLAGFVACVSALPAAANEESEALVMEGIEVLRGGDLLGATDVFIEAYETDPRDAQAAFYVGVGMNRVGDFVQALAAFEEARRMGYGSPELDFESGWAFLGLGQYDLAIARLDAYEAAAPGRGKTSEFLARAWLAKGDTARAETLFQEAVARDPALRSSVDFQMAAIAYSQGDPERAADFLDSVVENDPDSALGQYLGDELRQLARDDTGTDKIWTIVATFAVGHDTNAIALGDASPLPAGISNQGGNFIEGALSGYATLWQREGVDQLTMSMTYAGRRYGDNLSNVDSESWVLAADYQALIRRGLVGRLQPYVGGNMSHQSTTNRYIGARGSLQFESFDITWEPWVSATYTDYNQTGFVAPADERSGATQAAGLTTYWWWDLVDANMRTGIAYSGTDTKGTNFDSHGWSAFIGFSKELANEVTADISFTMTNTDYTNRDTRATPPGAFNRADRTRYFSFMLSKPVWDYVTIFGRFDMTTNDSNIPAFTYDRVVTTAGIAATF